MHGTRALLSDSDGQASSSQLTPQQQSLADLMSLLLLNPDQIALLGFQLNTDVARLDSTFPWLHAVLARYQGSSLDDATSATATVEHDAEQSQQSALLRSARVTKVVEGVEVSYVEMTSLARSADPERFLLRMGGPHTLSLSRLTQEVGEADKLHLGTAINSHLSHYSPADLFLHQLQMALAYQCSAQGCRPSLT
jgi:hypothetical protein